MQVYVCNAECRESYLWVYCHLVLCSTMWVGCQSRWFLCLFWRETRQRILGPEISLYPEVVRGCEWELTTRPSRGQLAAGQQRSEQQGVGVEERTGAVNTGHRSREARQHGIGSSESESRWVWFQSIVEFSLVTHVSISPYMLSGMQSVAYLPLLLVNPRLCSCLFVCPIFSVPSIVFLCR